MNQKTLIAGAAGFALLFLGFLTGQGNFFKSYLVGYLFAVSIGLGALALILIHNLTGGAWGRALRPYVEPIVRTMPALALLFIPIAFGLPELYIWARPEAVAADALLQGKAFYLNAPFFIGRAVFYFASWNLLAFSLTKWSAEYARTSDPKLVGRIQLTSGLGLILFGLTGTFAAFDWAMSLEPKWYSTIYGLLFLVGATLEALALSVILFAARKPKQDAATILNFHDFGNLMLAFVMLWTYMSFSQFLLIWSANMPEETVYYVQRTHGGWMWVGVALALFHFFVPFILLLMRFVKRNLNILPKVALGILVAHFVDILWLVNPTFSESVSLHWMDLAAGLGCFGVWFGAYRLAEGRKS